MKKRLLSLILAMLVVSAATTGCTQSGDDGGATDSGETGNTTSGDTDTDTGTETDEEETTPSLVMNEAGYPMLAEKETFKLFMGFAFPSGVALWNDPNEIPFYAEYQELTNIEIEWEFVARTDYKEKANIKIAGEDLPDAFFKTSGISNADIMQYAQGGSIINIEPLLETSAPDVYNYFMENDLMDYMRLGDGIWGLPYIYDSEGITISKIFWHTDWLDSVGMDTAPTTLEEMVDTLNAMAAVAEEGQVTLPVRHMDDAFRMFGSAFGLFNRGVSNGWIDADPSDPSGLTTRFWRGSEDAKGVLELVKDFYESGVIGSGFFGSDYAALMSTLLLTGDAACHSLWTTVADENNIDKYIASEVPPAGYDGENVWNVVNGSIGTRSGMLLTKECANPEALLGWANYFYTEEGATRYFLGDEDVSFYYDEDGNTQLTDLLVKNPDGLSLAEATYMFSLGGGGGNPSLATDQTFKGGETYWTSLEGSENYKPYITETIWESLPLNAEQSATISTIAADLTAVITEYEAKFITGVLDIDADWQEYQDKLDQAGRQDYVAVYTEALQAVLG